MKETKIFRGLLTIVVIAAAMLSSYTDQGRVREDPVPDAPPPLEELIPPGERADAEVSLRVLFGDEVVNMTMERYLIGVVAAEMNASFEHEALKAQAVAARTNAMHNMQVAKKERHPDADVCTDPGCCTAFSRDELLRERWNTEYVRYVTGIITAVTETDGVYMSYEGEPILALFHSSSAGKTETSGNVWINDLPYLLSVDSPETSEQVPNYVMSVRVTRDAFIDTVLSSYPDADFDSAEESWVTGITHTASGRIRDLILGGVPVKGTSLRTMFGLRSTAVTIEWSHGDIVFTTTGFGHGVGMSQYGANVMASEGMDYEDILNHYYSGIQIIR